MYFGWFISPQRELHKTAVENPSTALEKFLKFEEIDINLIETITPSKINEFPMKLQIQLIHVNMLMSK